MKVKDLVDGLTLIAIFGALGYFIYLDWRKVIFGIVFTICIILVISGIQFIFKNWDKWMNKKIF